MLRCALPRLPKNCFHSSMTARFYPFAEGVKEWLEKVREDKAGAPSLGKRWLVEQKLDFHQKFANQSLVLMLVKSILTPCVSRCLLDSAQAANSMWTYNSSIQYPTEHDLSILWL